MSPPKAIYELCTTEGCPCIVDWEGECDPSHPSALKCKGPIVFDVSDPLKTVFVYTGTCTCPQPPSDDVCWGCYLDSK